MDGQEPGRRRGRLRWRWPTHRPPRGLAATALALVGGGTAVSLGRTPRLPGDPYGTGPVTLATGQDTTGYLVRVLADRNASRPAEPVTLVQLPSAADEVHAQMVEELQDAECRFDLVNIDVVWTAEFAGPGLGGRPAHRGVLPRLVPGSSAGDRALRGVAVRGSVRDQRGHAVLPRRRPRRGRRAAPLYVGGAEGPWRARSRPPTAWTPTPASSGRTRG